MKKLPLLLSTASLMFLTPSVAKTNKTAPDKDKEAKVLKTEHGKASWYEIKCNGGTHTASGIPLKDHAMTAAHKTLPMGTKVRVTNKRNGKSVVVKITDRGPYIKGRVIDVTKGAAKKLDFIRTGVVHCKVEVLED
ncbi:septal ring lytic transglycosylase RlpA family protein [Verrucomicrobiaceae bacterium N1E253]|uniref:Probable endolytic peptidoglycan transglycosylase RlpA n=1 Tax=Oceaniferula marina TaxID=2748318 RepID=A0A851GSG7_9BACT|nr:septal ring lytic transglycosylase RlpA family protein [Oceaniferula marina]NWK57184.1 septal ring lytic transglycosylase RlpA family protein [Oceaniferula marina]